MTEQGKLFVFIIASLAIIPPIIIYCINTLFGTSIELTIDTWWSIVLLLIIGKIYA